MAGIVGAGMVGVKRGQDLTMRACDTLAHMMSREERESLGIINDLPRTIAEARESFDGCWELKGVLGEQFVEKYLAVNKVSPHSARRSPICRLSKLGQKLEEVLRVKDAEEEMKKLVEFY
jgi:glutamine synthetase